MKTNTANKTLLAVLATLALLANGARAAEYYLRSDVTTLTLPNGSNVVMWGFARDSSFGAMDGTVTVPGPTLTVLPGDPVLTIHLQNLLPEPVSIVIPGQSIDPAPVRLANGRARSFTTETPTGNGTAVDYTWNHLRPGTFLYESGTHPAVQVQMGLYGCVRKDYGFGQTYPGVFFQSEAVLLYSEIDPALHEAVATTNYGPGLAMSSTIKYAPKYFMINGQCYTNGLTAMRVGRPGDAILLRFLNAGLDTHVPIVDNAYLRLIAEDGFPYPYPREQYSVALAAGKTVDALFTSGTSNRFVLYDRRLDMMNGAASPGGMLAYLNIETPAAETIPPAWWLAYYFPGGPPYPDGVAAFYIEGLDPTNPASSFGIASVNGVPNGTGVQVFFDQTVTNRFYSLQSTTNMITGPWTTIYSNVPGYMGSMMLTVPSTTNIPEGFFRVDVQLP